MSSQFTLTKLQQPYNLRPCPSWRLLPGSCLCSVNSRLSGFKASSTQAYFNHEVLTVVSSATITMANVEVLWSNSNYWVAGRIRQTWQLIDILRSWLETCEITMVGCESIHGNGDCVVSHSVVSHCVVSHMFESLDIPTFQFKWYNSCCGNIHQRFHSFALWSVSYKAEQVTKKGHPTQSGLRSLKSSYKKIW